MGLEEQIKNIYGEFTGVLTNEKDYIKEYVDNIISEDVDDRIVNFEELIDSSLESEYDQVFGNMLALFEDNIGIKIDIDRDIISFEDLYDIYITFVLDFKHTVWESFRYHYITKKNMQVSYNDNTSKYTDDMYEYYLSDEFLPNDEFIQNASSIDCGNIILNRIVELISDNVIFINHVEFEEYINRFVRETFI
jgi:hypothetical protein